MTKRALLIGAQTFGLRGVHADVEAVDAYLAERGFDDRVRLLDDDGATRDGILRALRRLIEAAVPGDTAWIYYSGHGGRIDNPQHDRGRAHEPRAYHCIIPFDHRPDHFCGIFSVELSALLAELTARTADVTVLFDCCHAAGQVRAHDGPRLRARAIPVPWRGEIRGHRDWLREQGYDLSARASAHESNPHAIRLFACAAAQIAYEREDERGHARGLLTLALLPLLRDAAPSTTWRELAAFVRARVRADQPTQEPQLVGPLDRQIFGGAAPEHPGILTFQPPDRLSGGTLHGVRPRARYLIMPRGAGRAEPSTALAELEVTHVHPGHAEICLETRAGAATPSPGALAFPYDPQLPSYPILLDLPDAHEASSLAVLDEVRFYPSPAGASREAPNPAPTRVTLTEGERLQVFDRQGRRFGPPLGRSELRAQLAQLARVYDLLDHPPPPPPLRLWARAYLEWGLALPDGCTKSLRAQDARVDAGARLYLSARSHDPLRLYLNLLLVDLDGAIRHLHPADPEGIELCAGQTYTLGLDLVGQLHGHPIVWPDPLPTEDPRALTMLVVLSDLPLDLRPLESTVQRPTLARPLPEFFPDHVARRDTERAGAPAPRALRYARHLFTAEVTPPRR